MAASIDPGKASSSVALGKDIVTAPVPAEPDETTHFSVIDRNGLAVTSTYTLEGGYGSHVVVKGTGFLLNNEMGDFNRKPGETNVTGDIGTPANQIAPGKRMLSSMTPTMVVKEGRLVLLTGSPGGRTIINTVFADRPRRDGVRIEWPSGRRPGPLASPVAARSRDVRRGNGAPRTCWRRCARWGTTSAHKAARATHTASGSRPTARPTACADKRTPDSKASVPQGLTAPAAGR